MDGNYEDLTELFRQAAEENLSVSIPFIPQDVPAGCGQTQLELESELEVLGIAAGRPTSSSLDLRGCMSALELGDKALDCCEIAHVPQESSLQCDRASYPPRIAPSCLMEGTPFQEKIELGSSENDITLCQSSPCPSLLLHWDSLNLSKLLRIVTLQLIVLESFIGTNNGGSSATETLYCMLWCHDGILLDMSKNLGLDPSDVNETNDGPGERPCDLSEVDVAKLVLFASSLGVVRIAEAVRYAVINADIYEEEDFGVGRTDNPGVLFCQQLRGSQFVEFVWDKAQSHIRRFRNSMKCNLQTDEVVALETVLRWQQVFFQGCHVLSSCVSSEMVIEFTRLAEQKSREAEGLIQTMHTCPAMLELMNIEIVDTVGRLQPTESEDWDGLLSASFDPFVNRRLLGNTPVRKSCFRRLKSVLESLSSMSNELCWGVCDLILQGDTLSRIMRMLEGNSMRGCPPFAIPKRESEGTPFGLNILSRSLLALNLYFDDQLFGQHDLGNLIASQMISWGVPELLLDIKYDDKPFMARLAKPIYDTLKALCFNRQREITYIESILLPAFQNLQYEAAAMDDSFREKYKLDVQNTLPYASNFVIVHTLRLMERYLALQCEVGLYTHPHDLQVVYWYRDFLLSAHVSMKGEIARDKSERSAMELQIGNGQKKEISEQGDTIKKREFEVEDRIEMTALILKRNISRGLVRYMSVLQQVGLLSGPPSTLSLFSSLETRFKRRFWAFKQLPQPPCLTIDDFRAGTDFYSLSSKAVIESASDCFRSSKNIVDQLLEVIVPAHETDASRMSINQRFDNDPFIAIHRDEILALAKVCVGNSLYLHKLASMISSQTDLSNRNKVSVEHKVHRQFCTLGIK